MRYVYFALVLAILSPAAAKAAGLASNANFIVLTPAKPSQEKGDKFAQFVMERADEFRAEVAREWLDETLPDGGIRTIISVNFTDNENSGFTWAKDDARRKFHNVYLSTSPLKASGTMLHHEIAHTVFATKFPHPNRLPPWAEEGIACCYDDETLISVRQQEVRSWMRTGRTPNLVGLLNAASINSFDDTQYAVAESLVRFLTTLGDKPTLVRFADEGHRRGWNEALRSHYKISGVQQLQSDWQTWLRDSEQ